MLTLRQTADEPHGSEMSAGMAAAADRFSHPALLYRGHEEYLAGTVPFITDGLAGGDPVAVAVPTSRLDLLRTALGAAAADVRLLDMSEVGRNPGRIIPGVLRAFADPHTDRHVRIVGELVWPQRSEHGYPACVQHEALINRAFSGLSATILCPYDADRLDPAVIEEAARTHPVLIDGAGPRASMYYSPDDAAAAHNLPLLAPDRAEILVVDPAGLAGLRRVTAAFARGKGLDADRTEDLVLALGELVTNSIEHAGGTATVLLGGRDDLVVCQVHDTGHLADPLVGRRPVPPTQLRGRGLLMVNQLADLVRVHTSPDATCIEVRFSVP
jgi:anti-sigma regulatory factor (Ser/Thr protein kinase)